MSYLRDPAAIYAQSFATIRAETNLSRFSPDEEELVVRLIHACGMTGIANDLVISDQAITSGRAALVSGKPIICDVRMVVNGIICRHLSVQTKVLCAIADPQAHEFAKHQGTTMSAGAMEVLRDDMDGAIVAIGNAPTALFHLLEGLDRDWPRPAIILGFPVGFVGAEESKAELIANSRGVPFIALKGRRGGSAMAAAAVNALAAGLGI